ncbi:MAG: DeoR/GlpR family DNA-binding transcription regulator [Eubacteriales bacterium]|nr:DeoR/GlpR family DNA-binding transcription regulator [Clostridiales bacterium]MDD2441979.1 DeoR/GlpR family DNA-binding transcription regulator [Eubacteriales bacterium]MDD4138919.1 DeoR/GlpR family DNA-binding transcription regulator [Eubacteriales bacterium]MDD4743088.1 DeoR/GlpR family DNA-binding transcription regulator [Eubacteriales bacterium]
MTADRREAINQYIQSRGEVRLKELEQRYTDVSSMTLRRDLEFLERQGRIVRIRGGAKSLAHLSMLKEAAYTQRQVANTDAKLVIADKAIRLLSPGRSVYIDSGTTCMCFAQRLPDQNLFVLTPAPNIALELVKNANVKINLTGGQLNRETLTLSGFNAIEYVKTLNIDLAFVAASAFSLPNGFTCGDYFEAELKRLIIRKARQVVILMDASKLNSNMPYTFARLQNIYALVSDILLPDEYQKAARQAHVLLL